MTRIVVWCMECGEQLISIDAQKDFEVSGVKCSKHPEATPRVTKTEEPPNPRL